MHANDLILSEMEIDLLKYLFECISDFRFSSPDKKKQFWQDLRILQYEYFGDSLPAEMTKRIDLLCGDG